MRLRPQGGGSARLHAPPSGIDPTAQVELAGGEPLEVLAKLPQRQVARVQAVEACAPKQSAREQAVALQRGERLLDREEGHLEDARQLARIRFFHQGEREEGARAGCGAERRRQSRCVDHDTWSFDHELRSPINSPPLTTSLMERHSCCANGSRG